MGKKKFEKRILVWPIAIIGVIIILIAGSDCTNYNPGQVVKACADSYPDCDGTCSNPDKTCKKIPLYDNSTNQTYYCGCEGETSPEPESEYTCETQIFEGSASECLLGTCPLGYECQLNLQGTGCACFPEQPEIIYNDCGIAEGMYFFCQYPNPDTSQGCYSDDACKNYAYYYNPSEYDGQCMPVDYQQGLVCSPALHHCPDGTCYW